MMMRMTLAALVAASLAVAGCSSSTSTGGTAAGTDSTTTEDTTTVTDITTGSDTATGDTTTKDAGKDTVKADVGPPTATWGECAISDTACLQACVPSNCSEAGQACQADKKCMDLQTCFQNCGKTPAVLPPQDGTPVVALPGETTDSYCQRVCTIQGGPAALAEDEAYIECVIGKCIDCATSSKDGISKASCQQACGLENYCIDEFNACLGDTDCLLTYGCLLSCPAGEAACQQECQTKAPPAALTLLKGWNDCGTKYKTTCVAP